MSEKDCREDNRVFGSGLYSRFLDILRCPSCGESFKINAFEQINREIQEGVLFCACGLWFPITAAVPRLFMPGPLRPDDSAFLQRWSEKLGGSLVPLSTADSEKTIGQVQEVFKHKWTKQSWWGMEGSTAAFMENWLLPRYGWKNREHYRKYFSGRSVCLDAGCGLGREASRMASANPAALVIGLELSGCVDEARKHALKNKLKNLFFIQADLGALPLSRGSFDFIISEGVLHHTPDAKKTLAPMVGLLKRNAEIGFYVYRKKAPLREYSDDFIRKQLSQMSHEEAWKALESLTKLGKDLSELGAELSVGEDVPLLGIKKGKYDLQRFIYYNMFKCFWNPRMTFDENVLVNFDWYSPCFSWRYTEDQVRTWLRELGLTLIHESVEESGITVRGKLLE